MNNKHHHRTNYYFVFQNKSFEEESRESYLWAPKRTLKGAKVSHWQLMTEVKEGDYIIHSFQKQIKAISRATSSAYTFENPKQNAEQWMPDGWKIDADYFIIDNPMITSDYKEAILKFQPKENAPFNKLGKGNTGYLFKANKNLFDFFVKQSSLQFRNSKEKEAFLRFCESSFIYDLESEMDNKVVAEINRNPWLPIGEVSYNPIPKEKPTAIQSSGRVTYVRDPIVSKNALARAEFKCEIDAGHPSFIRRYSKQQYTEPHHLIPMSQQSEFEYSLDVEANIVSLCSNCHNQIHYGEGSTEMVKLLFEKRQDELNRANIHTTIEDMLLIYNLENLSN